MLLLSFLPPVAFDHVADRLAQSISFGRRKVGLLVFAEDCQNKHRQARSAEQINNSCAAALAPRTEAEPHLANSAAAWDDNPTCGVSGETIHDDPALFRRK